MSAARAAAFEAPSDHVRILHAKHGRGGATIAVAGREDKPWHEWFVPAADLSEAVRPLRGTPDAYISYQSFHGWRGIANLHRLGALYADLDYHTDERLRDLTPGQVCEAALHALSEVNIVPPSYALSTGRGLLMVWLHDPVPRAALPRWKAMQGVIHEALKRFRADPRAMDAARVFRLLGTKNSKSGGMVRPVWPADLSGVFQRWNFEDLATEILPVQRADLHVLAAERAKRRADAGERSVPRSGPVRRLTIETYYEAVLTDLQRLLDYRWFGELPSGQRDEWLFLASCAMAHLTPIEAPEALERECKALAQRVGGWNTQECQQRLQAVFDRARMRQRGEKVEWAGQQVDALYRFKAETIVKRLAITPVEMRDAGLRVLVDADRRRELNTERSRLSRKTRGVSPGESWETYKVRCRDAAAQSTAEIAARLRTAMAGGVSLTSAAAKLGLSKGWASRVLKKAGATAAAPLAVSR